VQNHHVPASKPVTYHKLCRAAQHATSLHLQRSAANSSAGLLAGDASQPY
jgi:hypothetical protein